MAALRAGGSSTFTGDGEAPSPSTAYGRKRGGWSTTLFILAALAGSTLAATGWLSNLIVFLIEKFNIKSIDAAQISNVISGSTCFFPVIAAIVADSFLGCFTVIWISSLISVTGLILMMLTVKLDVLRPQSCERTTNICPTPTKTQYAVLYSALALLSIGLGGSRFTMASMGANQFTEPDNQAVYFNWYFFTLYTSSVIGSTGIVYVEDKVSWAWGFSICVLATVFGLAMFLLGRRYYCEKKPEGSPFTSLARVIVASIRKRKTVASFESEDYYYGDGRVERMGGEAPSKSIRNYLLILTTIISDICILVNFSNMGPTWVSNSLAQPARILNRAAFKTEGDILPNGTVANPWKICTVQQLEDLKSIIRITPLWSTSIFLGTPIGIQGSLSVLQALNMDRHLSRHFQVPAGSIMVVPLVFTAICLSVFDHYICPLWKKMRGKNLTPLQQIGVGHVINVISMAVSALVESKRRDVAAHSHHLQGSNIVPLSVLWLVPQLATVGMGEAFHFPGQVALYYQEFPNSLKNMSSAMMAMLIGISFYLSTAVIDFLRRVTPWLPDNINDGRLDNVYRVLVVLGVINFGYYLVCSWFHKYKNIEKEDI